MNPQELARLVAQSFVAGVTVPAGTLAGGAEGSIRAFQTLAGGVEAFERASERLVSLLNSLNNLLLRMGDYALMRVTRGFETLMAVLQMLTLETDIFSTVFSSLTRVFAAVTGIAQGFAFSVEFVGEALQIVGAIVRLVTTSLMEFIQLPLGVLNVVSNAIQSLQRAAQTLITATTTLLGGITIALTWILGTALRWLVQFIPVLGQMLGAAIGFVSKLVMGITAIATLILRDIIPVLMPAIMPILMYFIGRFALQRFGYGFTPATVFASFLAFGTALITILTPILNVIGQVVPIIGRFISALGGLLQALGALLERIAMGINRLAEITLRAIQGFLMGAQMLWQVFGLVAARAQSISIALQVMGANAGIARERILNLWQALTKQNIALLEGGQSMIMLLARFGPLVGLIYRLAEVAKDWAAAMGFVSSEVLRDFAVAVTRGEISMLEHLNIVYTSSLAWELFAQQIGKSGQDLNAFERSLAVADFLINRIGRSVRGVYEETFQSLGKLLTSFQRVIQTVQILAGRELMYPFTMLGKGIYTLLDALGKTLTEGARYGRGLQYFFAAIGEGVTQGLEAAFSAPRTAFFERDPQRNPISQVILAVLSSPELRRAAETLGGVVRDLTATIARVFLNILQHLPNLITSLARLASEFTRALIFIWTWLKEVAQGLLQLLAPAIDELSKKLGITGQGIVGLLTFLGFSLANFLRWLASALNAISTHLGTFFTKVGEGFEALAEYISLNHQKITEVIGNFLLFLQGIGPRVEQLFGNMLLKIVEFAQALVPVAAVILVALGGITGGLKGALAGLGAATAIVISSFFLLQYATKMGKQLVEDAQRSLEILEDPNRNPLKRWVEESLPGYVAETQKKLEEWGAVLRKSGQGLEVWGKSAEEALMKVANVIEVATIGAATAAEGFVVGVPLSEADVNRFKEYGQALEQSNRALRQTVEIVREVANAAKTLGEAVGHLRGYLNEMYGTFRNIVALGFVQAGLAWREVEVAFTNIVLLMHAIRDNSINVRDAFGTLEELANELYAALEKWAKAINTTYETIVKMVGAAVKLTDTAKELALQYTFGGLAALRMVEHQRQLLFLQIQFLQQWLRLPLGYERLSEVTHELLEALRNFVGLTRTALEIVHRLTEAWADALDRTGRALREWGEQFTRPLAAFRGTLAELQAILIRVVALWAIVQRGLRMGDIPYEMLARSISELNELVVRFYTTLIGVLTRPLDIIIKGLDAQLSYWRQARDLVNSFNLGLYATLSVHYAEAQVLMEKLRLLELLAQINRYNAEQYFRIHAEILNIKKELLEIARRPAFFFGMTREQLERSFNEFVRLMADPRFGLRWRLWGLPLAEMALRVALWTQQPGIAAVSVPDPFLLRQFGILGAIPFIPALRWLYLLSQVTGRPLPVPFQTLLQAIQFTLLRDIMSVPPPLTGFPHPAYFYRFFPIVSALASAYGAALPPHLLPPSPFQPTTLTAYLERLLMPILTQLRDPMWNVVNWLRYIGEQARNTYQLMTTMAQTLRFYMPAIDSKLLDMLIHTAYQTFMFQRWLSQFLIFDPQEFVRIRREVVREHALRHYWEWGRITMPGPALMPEQPIRVPVMMGGQQWGTLEINPQVFAAFVQQVLQAALMGYVLP